MPCKENGGSRCLRTLARTLASVAPVLWALPRSAVRILPEAGDRRARHSLLLEGWRVLQGLNGAGRRTAPRCPRREGMDHDDPPFRPEVFLGKEVERRVMVSLNLGQRALRCLLCQRAKPVVSWQPVSSCSRPPGRRLPWLALPSCLSFGRTEQLG